MTPFGSGNQPRRLPARRLPAALLLALLAAAAAFGAEPLSAILLTSDLGDPRAPGNLKMILNLPPALDRHAATARAEDFAVYVHPAALPDSEGMADAYRAVGIYLWRRGGDLFLDVREPPLQDEEGEAAVRVLYAPDGVLLAEGRARGTSRYASELADVVLAVDVSRSMIHNDPGKRRVAAARAFLEMAGRGGGIGRVGLVTFNHRARANTPLLPLERGDRVLAALRRVGASGLTNLDAPLRLALGELAAVHSRRPVVILMTDGRNEGSSYKNTHRECAEAGVRLFTVGLGEAADHELLADMAAATGGMYFGAAKDSDLPEIYARLAAELGKRRLLHAEVLAEPEGDTVLPVDGTVRRLVAMTDTDARIGARGPAGSRLFGGDALAAVRMGVPEPGDWEFAWENATPERSLFALFGDTRFFLDVFPPQWRGGKLAIGATLADGARPLPDALVWLEPAPGLIDTPVRLYDDGLHGDGLAGDGVYGAVVDCPAVVDSFGTIVRASGTAWEQGRFVRQAVEIAVRTGEASPGSASLDGEVDFGVLFPGETGTATAHLDLDAPEARRLFLDLVWEEPAEGWPTLASAVSVGPGRREIDLELTVPEGAAPGGYAGSFTVSDGADLEAGTPARVRVGAVRFADAPGVDLGDIPPGTFAEQTCSVRYDADKPAPLAEPTADSDSGDLAARLGTDSLEAGPGSLDVIAMVGVPIDRPEGAYRGRVTVHGGPGRVEVPVRWRVKALTVATPAPPPMEGLPEVPDLSPDAGPPALAPDIPETPPRTKPPLIAAVPAGEPGDSGQSPWEKTAELFETPRDAGRPAVGADIDFPALTPPGEGGSGIWNAWWIYLLAALLLLFVLLLLLAYILYRLGKSSTARFLLVSAAANLLLLAVFLMLLGTSSGVAARETPRVSVTLTEDEYRPEASLTASERDMLTSGASGQARGGAPAPAAGELTLAEARAPGAELVTERRTAAADSDAERMELTNARPAAAVPLPAPDAEPLSRRARRPARTSLPEPETDMPEMAEPPLDAGPQPAERAETPDSRPGVGEIAVDVRDLPELPGPVWSESDRNVPSRTLREGTVLAEAAAMEAVTLEETRRRLDPRGRPAPQRETPVVHPEPRVAINDPARDGRETPAPEPAPLRREDPGVGEIRVQVPAVAASGSVGRPGVVVTPPASRLRADSPQSLARVGSGTARTRSSPPRGGARSRRGGGARSDAREPAPSGGLPGGMPEAREPVRPGKGTGREPGGETGEKRFEDGPGGTASLPGRDRGGRRRPGVSAGADTESAAPNPFAGRFGVGREEFPASGDTPGRPGNGLKRSEYRGNGKIPAGPDAVPGDAGGTASAGRADAPAPSSGARRGRGVGEGRFDAMTAVDADPADGSRRVVVIGPSGRSLLPGDETPGAPEIIPHSPTEHDWRRRQRPPSRRRGAVATGAVDADSLLIVVGDFSGWSDLAAENLFATLARRLTGGMTVEARRLSPADPNLADCLLAIVDPGAANTMTDDDLARLADYFRAGGHLWLDAPDPERARPFMERLAAASGGSYAPLSPAHQLADGQRVDALTLDGEPAAVVTYQNWRAAWRGRGAANGAAFRFLIRCLNYFLSGNAEQGIVLRDEKATDALRVEPAERAMPETLSDGRPPLPSGRSWDDFAPDAVSAWRQPSWSDPGRLSGIPDGQGGHALRLSLEGAVKGRAAVSRDLGPPGDFTGAAAFSVEAHYNGSGEAALSLVLTLPGAGGWTDYETPAQRLAPGWNRLRFSLDGNSFRSLAGGGGFDRALPAADRVGRVGFFLYRTADSPAGVLFRDARLHDD